MSSLKKDIFTNSSIFPIHHDTYGFPTAKRFPHVIDSKSGRLFEFPPSTYSLFGQNIPFCGGGYLRLLPECLITSGINKINLKENQPVIIYVHPWEIDIDQPRMNGRLRSNIRHYLNLKSTLPKIRTLLGGFKFKPLSSFADHIA